MEDLVRKRIMEVFALERTNPSKFSKEDKAMQKRLSRQLNGGATITFETISSILNAFQNISAEWLLRGEGEMYKTVSENKSNNFDESQYVSMKKYETIVTLFGNTASELKEAVLENKKLHEEIKNLKEKSETPKSA
jgi:CRISPR/Cas system-associated protein Cas5 (RAMP superfamily)